MLPKTQHYNVKTKIIFGSILIFLSVCITCLISIKHESVLAIKSAYTPPQKKEVSSCLLHQIQPTLKFLENCHNARIDWTTSIPISSPPNLVREKYLKACGEEDLHTYYNNDISVDLLNMIEEYFLNRGIPCTKNQLIIRYTAFDIIRDFYSLAKINDGVLLVVAPTFGYYIYQAAQYNINTELVKATAKNGWKITAEDLDQALKESKAKVILFTNPVNPTGVFYSRSELAQLAEVIKRYDAFVISDEVFSDIYFCTSEKPYSIAAIPGMAERTLTIFGLGKGRGLRLSFSCCPVDYIPAFPVSGIYKSIQIASAEALRETHENQSFLTKNRQKYEDKIKIICKKVNAINLLLNKKFNTRGLAYVKQFTRPVSTNIILLSFSGLSGREFNGKIINTGLELATFIYLNTGVALVPGEGFFINDKEMVVRIPTSVPDTELEQGLSYIANALQLLN